MAELPAEARELLTARNVAHVAVLMSNGAPQVAPVWITLVGGRPAIFSEKENLRQEPAPRWAHRGVGC